MAENARTRTVPPQPRRGAFVRVVLNVTLEQLAEVGFERLSIPEVATLAGVNKTSIYRRWPGKSDLVRDALSAAMSHADHPPDTGELRGDLVGLARSVAAFTKSRAGTAVVRILLAEAGNPELRALANSTYGEIGGQGPWKVLARAAERSELRRIPDPSLILFTIAGAILHRVFVEQKTADESFLAQLVDLVLLGAVADRYAAQR